MDYINILDKGDINLLKVEKSRQYYDRYGSPYRKRFILLQHLVQLTNKYPNLNDAIKNYIVLHPEELYKVNEQGRTALHIAILKSSAETSLKILNSLILAGSSKIDFINIKDNEGMTALVYACYLLDKSDEQDMLKKIQCLLKCNPFLDINAKDRYGWTALQYAIRNARYIDIETSLKILRCLLEYGGNVSRNVLRNINVNHRYSLNYNTEIITNNEVLSFVSRCVIDSKIIRLLLDYDASPGYGKYDGRVNVLYNDIKLLSIKN